VRGSCVSCEGSSLLHHRNMAATGSAPAPKPLYEVEDSSRYQEILLRSEFNHQQFLKAERHPCAPPPEECLQPVRYESRTSMAGLEARPPTVYPMKKLGRRPRVVLLHGTACNNNILKTQLRALSEPLNAIADVHYIQGGMVMTDLFHPTMNIIREAFGEQKEHWYRQYVETSPMDREAKIYGNFDFGIAKFEEELAKLDKPVDALIGFSQGGLFSALLAARALKRPDAPPPFHCVILLNPPNPVALPHRAPDLFTEPLATPALVSKGLADDVVPGGPEMYASLFSNIEWAEHADGHQPMPAENAEPLVNQIINFLKKHS